ncbi:MAG: hypothetical protein R3Y61_01045 [Rikenellaceae bacterium]
MELEDLDRVVQSVGSKNFLKYFDLFWDNYMIRSNSVFREAFKDEPWTESSKNTIISKGKAIFKSGLVAEVLDDLSKSTDTAISAKATETLKRYLRACEKIEDYL